MKEMMAKTIALVETRDRIMYIKFTDKTQAMITHETVFTVGGHYVQATVVRYNGKIVWTTADQ